MNTQETQPDSTRDNAPLAGLERIKDSLTGDQCAAIGVYDLERNVTALLASHCALVAALETARRCIDVSLIRNTPKAIATWESVADLVDAALSDARKLMEGGAK